MAKNARWKIKIEKEKNNHGKKDTNSAAKKIHLESKAQMHRCTKESLENRL